MNAPVPAARDLVLDVGAWLDGLAVNRRHWLVFAVCAAAFLFDAFDFQVIALAMPSIARDWGLDRTAIGVVLAATPAGMLAGTFLFGVLCDRIGRRTCFQLTILMFGLFSAAAALAHSVPQLAALRFVAGIGMGGFLPVDTAIMTEFMPAARRGRMLALWAIFFSLGNLLAALVGRLVIPAFGWRVMFLLCLPPAAMVLVVRRWIPETPRFLLEHGRLDAARRATGWIALGRDCPALAPDHPARVAHRARRRPGLATLAAPALRRRTAVACLAWLTWSFSYFGLLLWLPTLLVLRHVPPPDVFLFVAGYTGSGIVGRLIASAVVDRIGRKPLILATGLASAVLVVLFGRQSGLPLLMLWGFLLAVFQDAGLGTVATYTPELFPTRLRASGTGLAAGVGRVATMVAPLAVAAVVGRSVEAVFVMFAAAYALGALAVAVLGRETRRASLEAVAPPIRDSDEEIRQHDQQDGDGHGGLEHQSGEERPERAAVVEEHILGQRRGADHGGAACGNIGHGMAPR
jgi:putative MFS transporter